MSVQKLWKMSVKLQRITTLHLTEESLFQSFNIIILRNREAFILSNFASNFFAFSSGNLNYDQFLLKYSNNM